MPLLERLVDEDISTSREQQPLRTLDVESLRESVRRELSRLLNTRCPPVEREGALQQRTTVNYGIPDFSPLSASNAGDMAKLAAGVEAAIQAFEPRLNSPRVTMRQVQGSPSRAEGVIQGHLVIETVKEPVSFQLALDLRDNDNARTDVI